MPLAVQLGQYKSEVAPLTDGTTVNNRCSDNPINRILHHKTQDHYDDARKCSCGYI